MEIINANEPENIPVNILNLAPSIRCHIRVVLVALIVPMQKCVASNAVATCAGLVPALVNICMYVYVCMFGSYSFQQGISAFYGMLH